MVLEIHQPNFGGKIEESNGRSRCQSDVTTTKIPDRSEKAGVNRRKELFMELKYKAL